jgi:ligand-binding SRPBCC domain-containing protein
MGLEMHFTAVSRIEAPAEEVFRWHAEPDALKRLTPPWEPVEVLEPAPGIRDGDRGVLCIRVGPVRMRWVFEHCDYVVSFGISKFRAHFDAGTTPIG